MFKKLLSMIRFALLGLFFVTLSIQPGATTNYGWLAVYFDNTASAELFMSEANKRIPFLLGHISDNGRTCIIHQISYCFKSYNHIVDTVDSFIAELNLQDSFIKANVYVPDWVLGNNS